MFLGQDLLNVDFFQTFFFYLTEIFPFNVVVPGVN